MNDNYEPVIGLEVHIELNTKTKMFCRCSADYFGKEPNTHTCPVCLGLPGAVPFTNKEAIEKCIKIGLALKCEIVEYSRFERKNYFYPDLPKGYQISQYRWPLCVKGWIEVSNASGGKTKIRINRVHQEEDTGKLTHSNSETLIDFNRSGVPLVEVVTEPDFHDVVEVREYAKKLQQIFRYLGVSNADMERGDMRLEANISVRPIGLASQASPGRLTELPNYRVELKNINSFRFMVAAIEYEIKRQEKELEEGRTIKQETRGWDENHKRTYLQRSKEEAHDYRYFPDPDLPELRVKSQESRVKEEIPELPDEKLERFISQYGLNRETARVLTESREIAEFFEKELEGAEGLEVTEVANQVARYKDKIKSLKYGQIRSELKERKMGIIDSDEELSKLAEEVIEENPKFAEEFKKGKTTIIMALVGAVMRKSGGKADAQKVRAILEKLLS